MPARQRYRRLELLPSVCTTHARTRWLRSQHLLASGDVRFAQRFNALHYTTSKAAVIGLTRGLARELGRFNIRVNAVAPATVETEGMSQFFSEKKEDAVKAIVSGQSIRRVLTTDDLVGTILYLASDASSMVTGQTIAVDGGTVLL